MDDSHSTSSFDDERAAAYDAHIRRLAPGYDALHAMVVSLLSTLLDEDAHVLVVGAGTGAEIRRLGRAHPGWHFTAVDPSPAMLDRCRGHLADTAVAPRVEYVCERVEHLDDGAPFDAATSIFVAHFIADPEAKRAFFESIADRLKPQAPFVLADLYRVTPRAAFDALIAAWHDAFVRHGASEAEADRAFARVDRTISFVEEPVLDRITRDAGFDGLNCFFQALLWGAWWTRTR